MKLSDLFENEAAGGTAAGSIAVVPSRLGDNQHRKNKKSKHRKRMRVLKRLKNGTKNPI
jgi:hypothetical protein